MTQITKPQTGSSTTCTQPYHFLLFWMKTQGHAHSLIIFFCFEWKLKDMHTALSFSFVLNENSRTCTQPYNFLLFHMKTMAPVNKWINTPNKTIVNTNLGHCFIVGVKSFLIIPFPYMWKIMFRKNSHEKNSHDSWLAMTRNHKHKNWGQGFQPKPWNSLSYVHAQSNIYQER